MTETPSPCGITVKCRGIETKDLGKIGVPHYDAQVTTASGQVHSLSGGPLDNYNGITALQACDTSPLTPPFTGMTVYQGSGCSTAGCLVNSTQQWQNSPVGGAIIGCVATVEVGCFEGVTPGALGGAFVGVLEGTGRAIYADVTASAQAIAQMNKDIDACPP